MCRLWGVSLGKNQEELDVSEIGAVLFPALTRGGPHAYGWITYNQESGELDIQKSPGRADTDEARDSILWDMDRSAKWAIGHTRYATHGSPTDNRNNHPIQHGNIIGVHNGVLTNHEKILEITGREDDRTQVDSEAIFAAVNRWGPKNGLRRIYGSMVTLYTNTKRPWVIHLGRTHGRSVTIGWTDKGNLIWASEEEALRELAPEIKFVGFSKVKENRLLIIRNGKIIQRLTFRQPPVQAAKKKPVHTAGEMLASMRPLPTGNSPQEVVERLQARRDAARASKRGSLLFPKGEVTKNTGKKLVFYNGTFVTEEEARRIRAAESSD